MRRLGRDHGGLSISWQRGSRVDRHDAAACRGAVYRGHDRTSIRAALELDLNDQDMEGLEPLSFEAQRRIWLHPSRSAEIVQLPHTDGPTLSGGISKTNCLSSQGFLVETAYTDEHAFDPSPVLQRASQERSPHCDPQMTSRLARLN